MTTFSYLLWLKIIFHWFHCVCVCVLLSISVLGTLINESSNWAPDKQSEPVSMSIRQKSIHTAFSSSTRSSKFSTCQVKMGWGGNWILCLELRKVLLRKWLSKLKFQGKDGARLCMNWQEEKKEGRVGEREGEKEEGRKKKKEKRHKKYLLILEYSFSRITFPQWYSSYAKNMSKELE